MFLLTCCLRNKQYCAQQGMVLVTILLFLSIFSLLVITSMSSSQLQIRMSNNLAMQNQMLQAAEAGLAAGEQQLLVFSDSPCIRNDETVASEIQPWLVGNSCILSYNAQSVRYTIERQYQNTCLITGIGASKQAILNKGDIYRITAWVEQYHHPALILQTTYAKAKEGSCINPINELKPGRLSWREVNNS